MKIIFRMVALGSVALLGASAGRVQQRQLSISNSQRMYETSELKGRAGATSRIKIF